MKLDKELIFSLVNDTPVPQLSLVSEITSKALALGGLSLSEVASLLKAEGRASDELIKECAARVKEKVFGARIVFFAPLYLTNYCTNGCIYCGFRSANTGVVRKALSPEEAVKEAAKLEEKGFKRALLVLGEDPRYGVDYIIACVRAIYRETGIRILHVNAPPMEVAELRALKAAGVGVYQSFQETYHSETYARVHPSGAKRDYDMRLDVMDKALEAGFNDVGIGALLGLYDFRFEVLATIAHSKHLYEKFSTHVHTISIPRLRPAEGSKVDDGAWPVTDEDMERVVSVFRLAVPTAGIVVTTRESEALRTILIKAGASQLSASSSTSPGGYSDKEEKALEQFSTNDHRTLEEVMASVIKEGSMPSLCTSCYRVGRVGESFTGIAGSGDMEPNCEANAILTFKEFLLDNRANGNEVLFNDSLNAALGNVKDADLKERILEKFKALEEGKRDLFF